MAKAPPMSTKTAANPVAQIHHFGIAQTLLWVCLRTSQYQRIPSPCAGAPHFYGRVAPIEVPPGGPHSRSTTIVGLEGAAVSPPKKPIKVLIPFGATRAQIEAAVEQLLGPDPEKKKPTSPPA